jgi:leucyl aminopeptidase
MTQISIRKGDLVFEKADLLVLNAFAGMKFGGGATGAVDKALGGLISDIAGEEHFKAGLGDFLLVRPGGGIRAKKIVVIGLGDRKAFGEEAVRVAAAVSLNCAKALGAKRVVSIFHGTGAGKLSPRSSAKAIVEGVRLGDYSYGRYKKESAGKAPQVFDIVTIDQKLLRAAEEGLRLGEWYAQATIVARDLVNTPGKHMSPADLVSAAKDIAGKRGSGVRTKVYDKAALERMGAGGILGVAQGSDHEPFLVHMTYRPKRKTSKTKSVALVGKAITFDSGGLSLKPAEAMMTMKLDMAGAADVLGVFSVIGDMAPDVEVHGIFGACENMPSGSAIRPGDVVEVLNGKTIEILNTDAEGRVTLADTLVYAAKQKPDAIIDLATLTGACMVALGEEITGIMSNNATLTKKIMQACDSAGENMWELPLVERYRPLIKSDVADYKNISGKYGGAITAGLLLQEFVNDTPWAHLDIAGPSFAEKPLNAYTKRGGTGHGVRTMLELLRSF